MVGEINIKPRLGAYWQIYNIFTNFLPVAQTFQARPCLYCQVNQEGRQDLAGGCLAFSAAMSRASGRPACPGPAPLLTHRAKD